MDDLCIVGGLVPSLIVDRAFGSPDESEAGHPGTNDLDVGMAVALLDGRLYAEVSHRLRQEGFAPDASSRGNPTLQRWRWCDHTVTVDFLLPPVAGAEKGGRILPLEGDFGVLIAPGLELAFDEREQVTLEGHTLKGERTTRTIPVCGPAAFVALKAFAFGDRGEPKDAFDLVYVIRHWRHGVETIAERLARHAERHRGVVTDALAVLVRDFASPELIGPRRVAEFEGATDDERDEVSADAHGHVDDLIRACRMRGLASTPSDRATGGSDPY
ncbi:MAG: nucleotidyl transferase AbiEii/AbiGii toxin family protein [Actinomycetota bacterium]